MPKYTSKAVQIEAQQLTLENAKQLAVWCGGQLIETHRAVTGDLEYGINIPTLEGVMRAQEGDYIIHGTHGEFYPCKANVFEMKYERSE